MICFLAGREESRNLIFDILDLNVCYSLFWHYFRLWFYAFYLLGKSKYWSTHTKMRQILSLMNFEQNHKNGTKKSIK